MRHDHQGKPCSGKDCVKANSPKVQPVMNRTARIMERTRDLLDEIATPELYRPDVDPYPASVGEVADEIARYVLELDTSGAVRGLAAAVLDWFQTYQQESDWARQTYNLDDLSPGSVGAGKSADPLPGMWEDSDLLGGEADGCHRP